MFKTSFKCFLVYYEYVFVYFELFAVTIFFFNVFIVSFKQISHLDLLLSVILYWVQKKPPEVFLKKTFSKITQYLQQNACVGVLKSFNKGLQACNYIKKRLQHRCFRQTFCRMQKFFRNTFFEKYLRTAASLSRLLGWVKVKKITERSSQ